MNKEEKLAFRLKKVEDAVAFRFVGVIRDKNGKIRMDYDPNRSTEEKMAFRKLMTNEEWEEHFG